jgi:Spy/CpxP family protein refolding chaperone
MNAVKHAVKHAAKNTFRQLLLAAAVVSAMAAPALAHADGADAPPPGMQGDGPPGRGMHGEGPDGPPPPFHGGGEGGGLPFLRGIALSEQQDDKLFALMHAQEPMLREQHKIVAKSHEALHVMAMSGKYDDAKAVALTQAAAQAMAKITLEQVRTEQQVLALLTPPQRQMVEQREQQMMAGREHGPGIGNGEGRGPQHPADKQ